MDNLAEILDQELETFNRFLDLLDTQHKQIISNDVEALDKTNTELEVLGMQTTRLEKLRLHEVDKIARDYNFRDKSPKIKDIIPKLDSLNKSRMETLRNSILSTHRLIERKTQRNKRLIDKSRKLINESMNIICQKPVPTYQKNGPEDKSNNEGRLLNRSA